MLAPAETAVTTPAAGVIVATEVLLLVQLPVPPILLSVAVPPTHMAVVPVIGPNGFTVTDVVVVHPVEEV